MKTLGYRLLWATGMAILLAMVAIHMVPRSWLGGFDWLCEPGTHLAKVVTGACMDERDDLDTCAESQEPDGSGTAYWCVNAADEQDRQVTQWMFLLVIAACMIPSCWMIWRYTYRDRALPDARRTDP